MAIFGSRRRGSSAHRQPLDANTTYAASVAARAAAAATQPRASSGLSSAAAAAALRSAQTSPEPVGSIQTKRMVRRGSNSSIGTASIMSGRGGAPTLRGNMQRRGSQSSMTERTFRSPSPGRSRTNSFANSPTIDAPPVPMIPKSIQKSGHQRSASVDPSPQRMTSPTPNGRRARTSSMDRSTLPPPVSTQKGARLSDLHESELERSNSQRKPTSSRPVTSDTSSPTSPTGKQYVHGTGAWHSEPVQNIPRTNGAPGPNADELTAKMSRIQGAQGQPVKRSNTTSSQGAQLKSYSQPTITGTAVRPQTRPQQSTETVMVYDSNSRTFVPTLKTMSAAAEPPVPTVSQSRNVVENRVAEPIPGTYDPHTRSIVPVLQQPKTRSKPAGEQGERQLKPGDYDPATRTIVPGVKPPTSEAQIAPPPRNPARPSPATSPRNSYLEHKPSIVREDPDEDAAASETPQNARIIQTSVGPAKSYVSTRDQHQRSSSLDVPNRNTPSSRGRQVSASPTPSQRKTHFSPSPVSVSERHEPRRDISPAKSALKHYSPPASDRAASPLAQSSKGPASDASSLYSQDGFTPSGKKKKTARVSFDEQPHEIDNSTVASSRALSRERSPILDDLDDEEFSKPRPALPTFGSVRKNREVAEKVTEMAPDRHESSNDHAIGGILHAANGTTKPAMEPMPPVVTSKDASAYISDSDSISDVGDLGDYAAAGAASNAAAAVVNLPEETAGQTAQIHDEPKERTPVEPIIRDFASSGSTAQTNDTGVPEIELLPPTPGTEEFKSLDNRQSAEIVVPGGWSSENDSQSIAPPVVQAPEQHSPLLAPIDEDTDSDEAFSDAAEEISDNEGGFASLNAIAVSPVVVKPPPEASLLKGTASPPESPVKQKAVRQTEGTNGTAEDKSSGDWTSATAYWAQLSREQRERMERDHMSSDDEARPKVKKQTKKTTTKPAAAPVAVASSTQSTPRSVPAHRETQPAQPALKKTMRAQPAPAPVPVESSHRMRTSMRDGGGLSSGSLRSRPSSAQAAAPSPRTGGFSQKTMRPQSSGAAIPSTMTNGRVSHELTPNRPIVTRQASSASSTRATPIVSQRLQKELSHDSDSESSFRKKKRRNNGGMTMRSSMRGGPVEPAPPAREQRASSPDPVRRGKGRDSFSIRSLSPTGSLFGRKKMKDVRESIRGSSVEPSGRMTTMRTAQPAKTLRQTPAATPVQKSSGSKYKSRFADSDDEDDDAPASRRRGGGGGFRSRFADSDDEDEVLTPVRGIPRRKGQDDGDSTDLDDSDAEGRNTFSGDRQVAPLVPDPADIDKAMEAARIKLGITGGAPSTPQKQVDPQGSALAQGSMRTSTSQAPPPPRPQSPDPNSARKKSFMGSILRRNRGSQASVMTMSGLPKNDAPPPPVPQQSTPTASPLANRPALQQRESSYVSQRPQSPTASPGKLIRRSSNQARQKMTRGESTYSTATAPPMIGESTWRPPLVTEGSWGLSGVPPVPKIPAELQNQNGDGRPNTSDGQGVRFSEDVQSSPGTYSTRTGKKKKFGMLRRAFRLHD